MKYYYNSETMGKMFSPLHVEHVYDRTGLLIPDNSIINISPIGVYTPNLDIDTLFYKRYKEILDYSKDKPIYIFYSGGIDSTAVLCAFLKHIENKDQIVVTLNDNSIKENPFFYKTFIENKLKIYDIDLDKQTERDVYVNILKEDGIVVTGELGDQIFPHILYEKFSRISMSNMTPVSDMFKHDNNKSKIALSKKLISLSPKEIKTRKDYFWLINYIFRYTEIQFRHLWYNSQLILNKNIFHFYDSPDWNNYSVSVDNETISPGESPSNVKLPLKQYIYEYDKNKIYLDQKTKEASVAHLGRCKGKYIINDKWERIQ